MLEILHDIQTQQNEFHEYYVNKQIQQEEGENAVEVIERLAPNEFFLDMDKVK